MPRAHPILLGVLILLAFAVFDQIAEITSPATMLELRAGDLHAIDGDTLAYGAERIRLSGIASPEEGHPVFAAARRHLGGLLREAEFVACRLKQREDRYGRSIGACHGVLRDGTRVDLQRAMVEAGFARACPGWGAYRYLIYENAESLALPFPGYCWPR